MEIREAMIEQYLAGLAMMRQCIERCPPGLWTSGKHPRQFWRIAFHGIFFTHLYLGQTEQDFIPWPTRRNLSTDLWDNPGEVEPYELPEEEPPHTQQEMTDYLDYVASLIRPTGEALDLDTPESGFGWYKNISKLSHQLLNIRHLQGHVGQLSELLMMHDIDIDWISLRKT